LAFAKTTGKTEKSKPTSIDNLDLFKALII